MAERESLTISEYLSQSDRKERILIVSDVRKGNSLMRIFENKDNKMVHNISCKSIDTLADDIYKYELAKSGYTKGIEVMSDSEALMLFRHLVLFDCIDKKELSYFNNKDILDIATTQELFNKINLVRSNRWISELEKRAEPRLKDVALLTNKYEEYLELNNKIDRVSRLISIIETIKGWGESSDQELKCAFSAEISCLAEDAEQFTGIQREFVKLLCTPESAVTLCQQANKDKGQTEILDSLKDKADFYKGYGSFNEANFIAYDILKKQIPFGKVTVLYSSDRQLRAISSALRGNKIPMKIISRFPANENGIILLAQRIIDWAAEGFSEKALERLLSSSNLKDIKITKKKKDGTEYEQNIVSFKYVQDARNRRTDAFTLGWGYERNLDFVEHELGLADSEEMKALLTMHQALLDIFKPETGDKYSVPEVSDKLITFIDDYSRCISDSDAVGIGLLRDLQVTLLYDNGEYELADLCALFTDLLTSLRAREEEDHSSVSVEAVRGWIPLERPYIYVSGQSLTEVKGNTTESPVLSDSDMEALPDTGYIPTILNESKQKEKDVYRTLSTFAGKQIVLGYSYFDSANNSMNNASSFYIKALKAIKGQTLGDVVEFVYGDDKPATKINAFVSNKNAISPDKEWPTSKSQLEAFLKCPKEYAYSDFKVLGVPDSDYLEVNDSEWMNAAERGNFFHGIAEKYANKVLHKPTTAKYDSTVDEDELRRIAEEVADEMYYGIQPEIIAGLADEEKEYYTSIAVTYFDWLHNELNNSDWRVLKSELRFDKAEFKIKDLLGNSYTFVINGYFDRLDYSLDAKDKKVYLRIVDYKSGKLKGQRDKIDNGTLIQHTVYCEALKSGKYVLDKDNDISMPLSQYILEEIAKLENNASIKSWTDLEFDSFTYDFPIENIGKHQIRITKAEIETMAISRLAAILTFISDYGFYPDPYDLQKALTDETKGYVVKHKDKNPKIEILPSLIGSWDDETQKLSTDICKYCSYTGLCAKRKAGDINDV